MNALTVSYPRSNATVVTGVLTASNSSARIRRARWRHSVKEKPVSVAKRRIIVRVDMPARAAHS
jgi:hypothetical protein